MQLLNSGQLDTAAVPAGAAKTLLCDQCRAPLGEKAVLTRDVSGVSRRFCPDEICIAIWKQGHRTVFRGS
jgi:hypothetical protein